MIRDLFVKGLIIKFDTYLIGLQVVKIISPYRLSESPHKYLVLSWKK